MSERVSFTEDGSIAACDRNCGLCFQELVERANEIPADQQSALLKCYEARVAEQANWTATFPAMSFSIFRNPRRV